MDKLGIGMGNIPCEICHQTGKTNGIIFGTGCNLMYCTEHSKEEVDSFYRRKKRMVRLKAIGEALDRGVDLPSEDIEEYKTAVQ
jgi:hypothetical protein